MSKRINFSLNICSSEDQPISGRQAVEGSLPGVGGGGYQSNYLQKRSSQSNISCDGHDELGCYQVRYKVTTNAV